MLTRGGTADGGYYVEVLEGVNGGNPGYGKVPVVHSALLRRPDGTIESIDFDKRFVPELTLGMGSVALEAKRITKELTAADAEAYEQWCEELNGIGPDDFRSPLEPADSHYGWNTPEPALIL